MRTIIAGSRHLTDCSIVHSIIAQCPWVNSVTTVVSGAAPGVDTCGELWATLNNKPFERYPADWNKHGRAAGPLRNQIMAERADALIAIPTADSRGTRDMIRRAEAMSLKVWIYEYSPPKK